MPKYQSIIFLLIVIISGTFSSEESELGRPIKLTRDTSTVLSCSNFWGIRCASCSKLQVCLGNTEVELRNCADINPTTPFCSDRACTAIPPENCKDQVPSSSFSCTNIGLFPNTNNCSRFFLCTDIGKDPQEFECPAPFIYSSKDGACKRGIISNDCQRIDCSRTPGKFIVYNPDKSILAYCEPNAEFPVLTRCPDTENQEYDPNTLECRFVCRSEGRFPDNLNCEKYYECLRNGGSFIKVHRNCHPFAYNRYTRQCEVAPAGGCRDQITTTTARPSNSSTPSNPPNPPNPTNNPSS